MICPKPDAVVAKVILNFPRSKLAETGIDSLLEEAVELNFSALRAGISTRFTHLFNPNSSAAKRLFTPRRWPGTENVGFT